MLVTGAAGFIGTNFVHYWVEHHPADIVVGLDALTYAGNLSNLEPLANNERFTFIKGDIRDGDAMHDIIKRDGIDTIVHFAAESHVDRSIHGPDPFIATNVVGTHELLKAARAAWSEDWSGGARRFHHISTDEVYGSLAPNAPAFTEENAYAPNSPYAASKAAADHLVRAYHHTYGSAGNDHQLLEQLRPLPFSREAHPAHDRQRPRRQAAARLRRWPPDPRLALRP